MASVSAFKEENEGYEISVHMEKHPGNKKTTTLSLAALID